MHRITYSRSLAMVEWLQIDFPALADDGRAQSKCSLNDRDDEGMWTSERRSIFARNTFVRGLFWSKGNRVDIWMAGSWSWRWIARSRRYSYQADRSADDNKPTWPSTSFSIGPNSYLNNSSESIKNIKRHIDRSFGCILNPFCQGHDTRFHTWLIMTGNEWKLHEQPA